jgi:hypothetical protein
MKNSFRDPVTNVLKGWGYTDSNGPDAVRNEQDDFNLGPGLWRLDGGAWVAYVPAAAPYTTTSLEYIERFTEAEQLSVVTAAMSNPQLRLWYDKLMAAQEVVFTDPRLAGGLDALVTAGLITAERKMELLTP